MLFDTIASLKENLSEYASVLDALSISSELNKLRGPIDIKLGRSEDNPRGVVTAHLATADGVKLFVHLLDERLLFVQYCDSCQQRYASDTLEWKCEECAQGEHRSMFDNLFALWRDIANG